MTEVATKRKRPSRRAGKAGGGGTIKVTLVRSLIGSPRDQRETAKGLGLRRLRSHAVLEDTPAVRGMVRKIAHALEVETVEKP